MGLLDHYLLQADAELAVGGAQDLREHFKVPASTGIDPVRLEQVLGDLDGQIRKAIGMSFDLDFFDALWFNKPVRNAPMPQIPWNDMDRSGIKTDARMVLAKLIWKTGAKNQAIPKLVVDDAALGMLGLEAQGRRLLALSTQIKPATDRHYRKLRPHHLGAPPCNSFRAQFKGYT
jgi:hypothetical protein